MRTGRRLRCCRAVRRATARFLVDLGGVMGMRDEFQWIVEEMGREEVVMGEKVRDSEES